VINHILVAIDGSECSRHAAYFARDLARQTGAQLTLFVAIEPPSAVVVPPFDAVSITTAHPDPAHLAVAQKVMDEVKASLPGGRADTQVTLGHPAETICSEAVRLGADLIVIGARGLTAAERILIGSVSEHVLRKAERPVLVVR
jgi:nucleotide-binding universal stress UspA family protein